MNNQTGTQPLAGHRTTLVLLLLVYTLSISDRMILSILFPDIKAGVWFERHPTGVIRGHFVRSILRDHRPPYCTLGRPIQPQKNHYSQPSYFLIDDGIQRPRRRLY